MLKEWRQGDFSLDAGDFLFAGVPSDNSAFDAEVQSEQIVGLIAISQSCDIVRSTGGRNHVAVCPLMEIDKKILSEVIRGHRPYLVHVENTKETVFADLRRVMSVDKDLLCRWKRHEGFDSEQGRTRFAAALERKFGQFAFPDDFDLAIKSFRVRVWSRHTKLGSEPGKVYRSLRQIRFRADPEWSADRRIITMVAILRDKEDLEVGRDVIGKELESECSKVTWPGGYEWGNPKFIMGTIRDLTAEDVVTSQRGDFEFLCC